MVFPAAAGARGSSSETGALLETTDWSKTPLGPRAEWPQSLRLAVGICLASRFPMFVWWGPELVNIYNDAYVPILGPRHPRAFGRPARESWAEIWGVIGPQADAVMEKGEATWNERVLLVMERHGYPEETWFTWSYSPIHDESGAIGGLFCACKEDTEAVHAEAERDRLLARMESDIHVLKEIEQSRQRMEEALASEKRALEMIATGSPLPDVLDTIARATEAQSTDGMSCSILVLDEAGERLLYGAPSLPESDSRARAEMPIVGDAGEVLGTVAMHYRQPHQPSPHDDDLMRSATHLAGIVLAKERADRRLRRSLEAEQAARTEAERASRLKDEFLATLSHELRTPLSAILGWTRIIRLAPDVPANLVRGVDVIERNANAQATIIEDLLDMSAILSGKVRLDVQTTDLAALVQAAVETASPAAQAKQIRVEALGGETEPLMIAGDASRLQQVLWNLLSNAVKFTPKEGLIQVELEHVSSQAQVRVRDTGAGIAPEFLPYVFDRFRQADASTTRRHGGLGLGLSIVKQLVELHGGSVAVTSDGVGQGTTFLVTLPIAAVRPAAEPTAARRPADTAGPALEDQAAVAGLRVLVVDDDADAREMVRRLLEERQCVVATAGTANEALDLLRAERFDVLISDIGMPGEDGHALIRRIRALGAEAGGHIPALALTAYARPEDRTEALRAGFQRHAIKPIDPSELFAVVASLAGRG